MTPLPEREVITPLGRAVCFGIVDQTDNVEWVTFLIATGEIWFWRNPHIRVAPFVTSGRPGVSAFRDISPALQRQIDRYKANGWL